MTQTSSGLLIEGTEFLIIKSQYFPGSSGKEISMK